jgi:glycogen synthase
MKRIGFLSSEPEPFLASNWSGIPASLAAALRSLGFEVVPVAYRLPRPLRHAVTLASHLRGRGAIARGASLKAAVRTRVLAQELAAADPLDGLIAVGTDLYHLDRIVPPGLAVATYDDGAIPWFMRHADSALRRNRFSDRAVATWAARHSAAARRATACCVSTGSAAKSMIEEYGVNPGRVHVVGMGHTPKSGGGSRDWSRPRLLFVGADWGRKNGEMVLQAFARFHAERPDAVLHLVGDHPSVDQPGVVGHGFMPREDAAAQAHLDELFARATAFVLPSRFDPSPIAYLEAASAGLPVIATTEGGAAELLAEGAIRVHPDDEHALVKAMHRLAQPETACRLGQEARRCARGSTWEAVAERITEALGAVPAVCAESAARPVHGPTAIDDPAPLETDWWRASRGH